MTIGKKINQARLEKGWTLAALASAIGMSVSGVRKIEMDAIKNLDPSTIIKIADALGDRSILTYALLHNPICQRIIPRAFTPLNNINDNPSAILTKLQEEMEEGIEAAKKLSRNFSHADPSSLPNHKEVLFANLEQILDVTRCVEEMFSELKECGALTEEEHLEIHIRQQAKVERNGHHKPEDVS